MFYHLDIEHQLKKNFSRRELFIDQINSDNDIIQDIYDGYIYKNLGNSEIGQDLIENKAFTLIINTDGISVSECSNLTIWPVF